MKGLLAQQEVRQAVQASAAAAVSAGLGALLSSQRWSWAVMTAFIVTTGAASREEGVIKGLQRLVGTIGGFGAGMGLGYLFGDNQPLNLGALLVCIFLAYYASQQAYGLMSFFITAMLALLFGYSDSFKPELMILRLEETAVGAISGVFALLVILPIRQNKRFEEAAAVFVEGVSKALEKAPGDSDEALAAAEVMEKRTRALVNAVGGMKRGWTIIGGDRYRGSIQTAMRCDFLARKLVRGRGADAGVREEARLELARLRDRVADAVR